MMTTLRTMITLPLLLLAQATSSTPQGAVRGVLVASGQTWPAPVPSRRLIRIEALGLNGAVVLRGSVKGARIGPVAIFNAYRAIETSKAAAVSDLVVDGVDARVQRECYRVRGNRITIRNMRCSMVGGPQRSPNLPEGLHIEAGDRILVDHGVFNGFQMTMADDRYWNGDGIAAEQDVTRLEIRNTSADDNTDGGFDIKPPVKMDRVSAKGNCRNFRLWSDSDIGTMTAGDSVRRGGRTTCAGLWIKGNAARMPVIKVRRLVVRMDKPGDVIRIEEGPADLTIAECDIQAPRGATLLVDVRKTSKVSLGKGCSLQRPDASS